MLSNYIIRPDTAIKILADKDFLVVKKNLWQVLTSSNPVIDIGDGFVLHIPRTKGALFTVNETRGRRVSPYEKIKGAESILDLGGFIGDTAVYFLKHHTKRLLVCEANQEHCRYIHENIQSNKDCIKQIHSDDYSVECMHAAVVTNTDIGREYLGQTGWGQGLVQMSENNKIPTVHIQDILDTDTFEALKMDIEGGEFPIMERFANHSEKFSFKKGYIEFHRVNQESYYDKTQTAIDFIQQQGYKIEVYDYPGNRIDRDAIKDQKKAPYIVVYFEKI